MACVLDSAGLELQLKIELKLSIGNISYEARVFSAFSTPERGSCRFHPLPDPHPLRPGTLTGGLG